MLEKNNLYRTNSGGVHSVNSNSEVVHHTLRDEKPRSAHQERQYILHVGVVSAAKAGTK